MSDTACKLIKEAVKAHIKEDGASNLGAYRDVITEVLHLAYKDRKVTNGKKDFNTRAMMKDMILIEGDSMFEEEVTNNEIEKICDIPKENLPTYINHEWETESGLQLFQQRLKGDDQ